MQIFLEEFLQKYWKIWKNLGKSWKNIEIENLENLRIGEFWKIEKLGRFLPTQEGQNKRKFENLKKTENLKILEDSRTSQEGQKYLKGRENGKLEKNKKLANGEFENLENLGIGKNGKLEKTENLKKSKIGKIGMTKQAEMIGSTVSVILAHAHDRINKNSFHEIPVYAGMTKQAEIGEFEKSKNSEKMGKIVEIPLKILIKSIFEKKFFDIRPSWITLMTN